MINIDSLRISDKAAICQWFRQFLKDHVKWWRSSYQRDIDLKEDLDQKQWLMLNAASTDPQQFVKVARNNKEIPIGIIWAVIKEEEWFECLIGQIYWIGISPDCKRHGVATKLMQEAESWFQSMHVQGRRVFVSAANEPAIHLYRKFGYEISDYRMLAPGYRI